jgi:hypothetical protein
VYRRRPPSTRYPAWIRTMNNASKGRCVTVTPRGTSSAVAGQVEPNTAPESLERPRDLANQLHASERMKKLMRRSEKRNPAERMGGDSNPGCLAAYTLSRRAQSTTLPPIQLCSCSCLFSSLGVFDHEHEHDYEVIAASGETVRRAAVECQCKIRRSRRRLRSPRRTASGKRSL